MRYSVRLRAHSIGRSVVKELRESLAHDTIIALYNVLRFEERPWTLNEHYLASHKDKLLNRYRRAYDISHGRKPAPEYNVHHEPWEPAIEVMAEVRAYFQGETFEL